MAASYSAGVDSGCAFIHADFSDSYLKIDSIKKSLRRSPSRTELPSVGDMKSGAAQKDDHLRVLATPRFIYAVFRQRVINLIHPFRIVNYFYAPSALSFCDRAMGYLPLDDRP